MTQNDDAALSRTAATNADPFKEFGHATSATSFDKLESKRHTKLLALAFAAAFTAAEPRRIGKPTEILSLTVAEAATDERATIRRLRERLARVLTKALAEDFREGLPSEFSTDLRELVLDFGPAVIRELQHFVVANQLTSDIGFEALTALASFNYSSIVPDRQGLIESALFSPAPEIRYGATLALATIREPEIIPALRTAIARENVADVRQAMEKVLKAVEEKNRVGASL